MNNVTLKQVKELFESETGCTFEEVNQKVNKSFSMKHFVCNENDYKITIHNNYMSIHYNNEILFEMDFEDDSLTIDQVKIYTHQIMKDIKNSPQLY